MSISDRILDRILGKILKNNKKYQHRSNAKLKAPHTREEEDTKIMEDTDEPNQEPVKVLIQIFNEPSEDMEMSCPPRSLIARPCPPLSLITRPCPAGRTQRAMQARSCLDKGAISAIKEAIESFQCDNNIVIRAEFEKYLKIFAPNLKLKNNKREIWKMAKHLGSALDPTRIYEY